MYVRNNRTLPVRQVRHQPISLGDFWADLFSKQPQVVVSQRDREIMARWPEGADTYRIAELVPFLTQLVEEAQRVLAKIEPVASRTSVLVWGPSEAFFSKVQGISVELAKIAVRMGKRAKFAKEKAAQGFTAIKFPDLRKDAFAMMSLTHSLDWLAELEGGPSWIGSVTYKIVEGFTRTGAWMIETGAKIAKPLLALMSSVDLIVWGALGVGAVWWIRKRRQS